MAYDLSIVMPFVIAMFVDMFRNKQVFLILFLFAFALFSSCSRPNADPRFFGRTMPRHGTDEFWVNNGTEPEYIDPGLCSDGAGGDVIWNTFAALTESHPATLEPIPDIAQRWDVSDDGLDYTFHLRPSKWSDGKSLTAHDFEWSWKRVLSPGLGSKYATIMYPLANAAAFHQKAVHIRGFADDVSDEQIEAFVSQVGPVDSISRRIDPLDPTKAKTEAFVFPGGPVEERGDLRQRIVEELNSLLIGDDSVAVTVCDDSVVGVTAVDELTLKVTLKEPVPYFLSLINHYTFMPVPRHVIEGLKSKGIPQELWTRPEHHVGNGAYRLKEWKFRQHMIFEKNPHYWNLGIVRTNQVKALMVESYATCLNMYSAAYIDYPGGNTTLPADFMDHLGQFQDFRNEDYLGVYFYWMNTEAPPLDNPNVRKALSLAIDRESICTYVTRAGQKPQADLVPDELGGYEGLKSPVFDPEQARVALEVAGYPGGKGLPPITLTYNTSEGHKQIASAVQQMWKDHLDIHVEIENQEWSVFLGRLQKMEFQMARMGWIGDYVDPNTFLELFTSVNGNNHSNWKDPQFDEMLRAANAQQDQAKRLGMLRDAEIYLMEQQPLIPIYMYSRANLVKPYVRGIWGNFQDRHLWKYVWIDDAWTGEQTQALPDDPLPNLPSIDGK